MSPLAIWNHVPTTLDLNGPSLSFTTQPTGLTTTSGLAVTFTGVATVSFPAGYAIEGNIAYQWYNSTDDTPVTDGERSNSRGGISTFSGAETSSLVILNCQYMEDNDSEYYLETDFKPTGYWRPGNESPNPNAINDKLNSDTIILKISSAISITFQPQPALQANSALFANFNVGATLTDANLNSLLEYQWKLNGNNLSDDDDTIGSRSPNLSIKRSAGSYTITVEVSHVDASPVLSDAVTYTVSDPTRTIFTEYFDSGPDISNPTALVTKVNLNNGPVNLTGRENEGSAAANGGNLLWVYSPNQDIDVLLELAAAGGASFDGNRGGRGGWGLFKLTLQKDMEYTFKLGTNDQDFAPWGGSITGSPIRGTVGGGGAFVYRQNRSIIALGGGGGAGSSGRGGDGGGPNQDGESGGGRNPGLGGQGGPHGRGGDIRENMGEILSRFGTKSAACISPSTDVFRDEGLSDCEAYSPDTLAHFKRAQTGVVETSTAQLFRGFRNGHASRQNGGWGINGAGGAGGSGAEGGAGALSGGAGGGGASGWADTGEMDVLAGRVGINANDSYARISLFDASAPLPLPPEVTPQEFVSIAWNNATNSGYRFGDPDNIGGSNQTVDGTILYGPQGNITTGITTSPPTDYAPLFTGYRAGIGGVGIYFNPLSYDEAFGLSSIDFKLYIRDYGPASGDNINYLLNNRANRDSSKGTVRKWYAETQAEVDEDPNLYTTDKQEAFVPFKVQFELAFACSEGGDYRVLYLTKSYEWTTFGQTQDIEFNSADLASQNNISGSNLQGNKLIFPDYFKYNYENPRIVYIRSKIINLDTNEVNTLNMYSVASSTEITTGTGNYLEFGKYLKNGAIPTGISPTVIPTSPSDEVTFTITREAADRNTVTWTRITNTDGPNSFTFGPGGGQERYDIEKGAVYRMTARTFSGGRGLNFRLAGDQTVQFDDVGDNDYNDLIVHANKGFFSDGGKLYNAPQTETGAAPYDPSDPN